MGFIHFAIQGLILIILADVLLSWVMGPEQFPRSITRQVTDPLYRPIHAILSPEKTGGIDLSPIILIFLLHALERVLLGAL